MRRYLPVPVHRRQRCPGRGPQGHRDDARRTLDTPDEPLPDDLPGYQQRQFAAQIWKPSLPNGISSGAVRRPAALIGSLLWLAWMLIMGIRLLTATPQETKHAHD